MTTFTPHFSRVRRSHGLIFLVLLITAGFMLWATFAEVEQYARSPGIVIASARTQIVQSANDGVIESVFVHEGDRVKKGSILARLDGSQVEAAQQDSLAKVAALKAATARLQAEVFGRPLRFPPEIASYATFVSNQTELFQRRQNALNAEISNLQKGLRLVREELDLSLPLLETGDIGKAEVIRLKKQVAEIEGHVTNRRNKYFQDAQAEMTKAEEDLATQEQVLAERTAIFERTELRAPSDGLVRKILLTTPGAKVRPGEVVMELLPTDSVLIVEVKLKPVDIAFIRIGLPAAIKLDAYDYSIYGILRGEVSYVSPDALTEDTRAGEQVYYRVHIRIDSGALAERNRESAKKAVEIQPGMTASVDIRTGSQTVFAYLTKPVTKTFSESLGER